MDSIIQIFADVFCFFTSNSLFGVPLLVYFVGFATFSLVIGFLKGKDK